LHTIANTAATYTSPALGYSMAASLERDRKVVHQLTVEATKDILAVFPPGAYLVRRVPTTGELELWVQEASGPAGYHITCDLEHHRYRLEAGPKPRPCFPSTASLAEFFKVNPYRKRLMLAIDAGLSDSVWIARP